MRNTGTFAVFLWEVIKNALGQWPANWQLHNKHNQGKTKTLSLQHYSSVPLVPTTAAAGIAEECSTSG